MDEVEVWAERIAREVAEDEVDLAPFMARAFVDGGREREELFRGDSAAVHGSFGAEAMIMIFPAVLLAIKHVGPDLAGYLEYVALGTETGFHTIGAIGAIMTLRGRKEREERKKELLENSKLHEMHDRLAVEVSKVPNLDKDKADLMTYRILKVMLEDPEGAAKFTRKVSEAP